MSARWLRVLGVALVVAAAAARAEERRTQVEVGAYAHDLDAGADWRGERLLVRTRAGQDLVVQVEGVHEERGRDSGHVASFACWADLAPRVYVFAQAGAGGGDAFMAEARVDAEVHVKLGERKRTVVGAGAGRVRFESDDVTLASLVVTRWFERAVLSYRYVRVDSSPRKASGFERDGDTHVVTLKLGNEEDASGSFDLTLLSGADVARDFVASGVDGRFRSRVASLAWRKRWSEHVGTHLQAEWGSWDDLDTRRGGEVRLVLR